MRSPSCLIGLHAHLLLPVDFFSGFFAQQPEHLGRHSAGWPVMQAGVACQQRGDAEMAQKLWRVVRACVELGPKNPIQQIHDQGAGGNCNVVRASRAWPSY